MNANDSILIGNNVEGYTVAEKAAWDLHADPAWRAQVADINRFIAWLDRELS